MLYQWLLTTCCPVCVVRRDDIQGLVVMSSATDRLSAPKAPPQQHHHLQDKCGHVRTVTDADSSELHLVAVGGHRRATGVNSGAKGAGGIGGGVSGGGVPSSSATSGRSHICAVVENEFGCDYRSVELLVSDLNEKVRVDELEKFAAQYALDEQIGAGRFGTVYQCVDKSTGGQVAAKIIKTITSKEILAVEREVEVLNQFRAHPKLLTLLGVYRGPKEMILVTEFVAGGELFERVVAEDFYLTEQDCVAFVRQILDAMQFVHSQNVLHLDLKPENILCTDATGHNIKIIDFGLAQHYDPSEDLKVLFGTPEFVAPEVISYEAVSPKSDMWSIGVITYVLLTGLSPFMGDTNDQTYQNVISVDYEFDPDAFEDISEEAIAFVSRLLVRDPTSRPSCAECLSDPWLSGSPGNPPLRQMPIDTQKLKSFVVRRKWLKGANVICALNRLGVFSGRSNSARLRVDLPGKQ